MTDKKRNKLLLQDFQREVQEFYLNSREVFHKCSNSGVKLETETCYFEDEEKIMGNFIFHSGKLQVKFINTGNDLKPNAKVFVKCGDVYFEDFQNIKEVFYLVKRAFWGIYWVKYSQIHYAEEIAMQEVRGMPFAKAWA